MSAIKVNNDNSIDFGNYLVKEKIKVNDFEICGDLYSLRSHNEITKITKNDNLLFESTPGTAVSKFIYNEDKVSFEVEGLGDTQITLNLNPEVEYKIISDDIVIGSASGAVSGKINFSVNLNQEKVSLQIVKK